MATERERKMLFKTIRPDGTSFYDSAFRYDLNGGRTESPGALPGGPCADSDGLELGGIHLGKSVRDALLYSTGPWKLYGVTDCGPILGEDDSKIRVEWCIVGDEIALSEEDLERLAGDSDWSVRVAIARRPDLSPALQERMAGDGDWRIRLTIARRPDLSPALQERMAGDSDRYVRAVIANLRKLAK